MSASQIPNLNTLRRGAGRGRIRGRGDGPERGQSYGSVKSKDRVVQGTDNDASVSRLSAVGLGYLEDPFAKALTPIGSETRRLPIINRGTYVRTTAIDHLVAGFLKDETHGKNTTTKKKQIISLGAGSDTRAFRLLSSSTPHYEIIYHEIDFAVNTAAKIKVIRATPFLQRVLGMQNVTISEDGDALHSPNYHIHPIDLRTLSQQHANTALPPPPSSSPVAHLKEAVDTTLSTLLISECCLVYLSPSEAADVVRYFTQTLFQQAPEEDSEPLGLILYEPIRPHDAFGRTMVSNLATRGIQLQTLHEYASLEAQRKRLHEQGFDGGQAAADIDFIWERWVSEAEKERVAGLEMLDETEEWKLLAQHYCIAWGWRERAGRRFEGWKDVQEQSGVNT